MDKLFDGSGAEATTPAKNKVCQSCWLGWATKRVRGADGKKRWKCGRCIQMVEQAKKNLRK